MPHHAPRPARLLAPALACCLAAATPALAQPGPAVPSPAMSAQARPAPPGAGQVSVTNAWARATIGGATSAVAYLTLAVQGAPDQLTGATTPVAAAAQLHSEGMAGGVMHMRPVESLALVPGRPVTLAPGGFHMMLSGLARPLRRGDSFPLTLGFRNAPPVTVQVRVEGPGASRPDAMEGMPGMEAPARR